jgi:hypothetical protein
MQFSDHESVTHHEWFSNYSYVFPSEKKKVLETLYILAVDPWIEEDQLEYLFEGLAGVVDETMQFTVVIPTERMLGVIMLEG